MKTAMSRKGPMSAVLLVLVAAVQRACAHQFLYFASPGDGAHKPGLYGGFLQSDSGGWAFDLRQISFQCVMMKGDRFYRELPLQGLTFDPLSRQVVLEMQGSEILSSAFLVALCDNKNPCEQDVAEVLFAASGTMDNLQRAKLGPYGMWNGTLYFVARRFMAGEDASSRIMRMEVRKVIPCEDGEEPPFTERSGFDLDVCSELVSLILTEVSSHDIVLQMRETLKPSDHLLVVEEAGELHFLLLVHNYTFQGESLKGYAMQLMWAAEGSPGPAQVLHHQPLSDIYTWHTIEQLGALSLRNNVLCWSATDRILCGRWGSTGLSAIRTVLPPRAGSGVCSGEESDPVYADIVTGLAIADVGPDGMTLYFGCYSNKRGLGGAGLLILPPDWSRFTLYEVTDHNGKVYAGSMFLTDTCDALYQDLQEAAGFELIPPFALQDPSTPGPQADQPGGPQNIEENESSNEVAGGPRGSAPTSGISFKGVLYLVAIGVVLGFR